MDIYQEIWDADQEHNGLKALKKGELRVTPAANSLFVATTQSLPFVALCTDSQSSLDILRVFHLPHTLHRLVSIY